MKHSTSNTTHTHSFARITKFHNVRQHETKQADQSAYDAMCDLMQVDACLFAAPHGFASLATESQMAKVASDFGLVLNLPITLSFEVNA